MDITPTFAFFDLPALYEVLNETRCARALSWVRVASEIGVSTHTLGRFASGAPTGTDAVLAVLAWLGLPPEHFMPARSSIEAIGSTWIDGPMRFDTIALFKALDRQRAERGLSWDQVIAGLGVLITSQKLRRLSQGGPIDIQLATAAAAWLGRPLSEFIVDPWQQTSREASNDDFT